MDLKSNNQVSRDILKQLNDNYPKALKFVDLANKLATDEKNLFKNLFFLEENALVQLMSSYPTGATYPTIHMVKIRDEGRELLADEERLDAMFPLKGFSSRLDFKKINNIHLSKLLETVSSLLETGEIEAGTDAEALLADLKNLSGNKALSDLTLGKIFENL